MYHGMYNFSLSINDKASDYLLHVNWGGEQMLLLHEGISKLIILGLIITFFMGRDLTKMTKSQKGEKVYG